MKKKGNKENKSGRCSFKDFLLLFPCCGKEKAEELKERLESQPRPYRLAGVLVPENLNHLSYGTLDDLRNAVSKENSVVECIKILLGVNEKDILEEDVNTVYGFIKFMEREIDKINKLFNGIKRTYSKEEEAAGIHELDFGSFGILDWYAKRMGIVNQNDVRDVAWVRIYTCMKNDNEQVEFEKRLQKQYEQKIKTRK